MKNKFIIVLFFINLSLLGQTNTHSIKRATQFSVGALFGLNNGLGAQINLLISNFADDFPFSTKLCFGISYMDPGDPLAARRIFINNNTNGVPEKSGRTWDFSLDFLYKLQLLGIKRNYIYAGPR